MLRSKRKKESSARFRASVSLVALIGLILGVAAGVSEISANRLIDAGLPNLAVASFVEELNRSFFRLLAVGITAAFLLFVISRAAPRSFRPITSVLFFITLIILATRNAALLGADPERIGLDSATILSFSRRFLVVVVCLVAARVFHEAYPIFRAVLQAFSLRFVVIILFLLAAANSAAYINRTKNFPRGQNVVLITADSVRPDHLGCFGYERGTSPEIDRLAKKSILFSSSYTPCPKSAQALASIVTGRSPALTGVRRLWDPVRPAEVTLAEILIDKGYETAAFATLPFPAERSGIEQGFELFRSEGISAPGSAVARAIGWMRERKKRPFFLWVHFPQATMPYDPPGEDRIFGSPGYDGVYKESFHYRPTRGCRIFGHEPLEEADRERAIDLYDGEIRSVDRQIGLLLRGLEKGDRIHNTLILLVGTHGESLGEHAYHYDHGEFLYDRSLHVPMLLSAANLPAQVVTSQVRNMDLLPTVLDVLHMSIPQGVEGRSLMSAFERPGEFLDIPLIAESGVSLTPEQNRRRPETGMKGKLFGIRRDRWKLIYAPYRKDEGVELYDLESDPGEESDLSAERLDRVMELKGEIESKLAGSPLPPTGEESPPPPWVLCEDH